MEQPFDTDWPEEPTRRLSPEQVAQIANQLEEAALANQAAYQMAPETQGGGYDVVTARLDGQTTEIIYAGFEPLLVEFLSNVIYLR